MDDVPLYTLDLSQVTLLLQDPSTTNAPPGHHCANGRPAPRMGLLAPMPRLMRGEAMAGPLGSVEGASNQADWLSGLLAHYPAAYALLRQCLQQLMPGLVAFRFERAGKGVKALVVRFKAGNVQHEFDFDALSPMVKCVYSCVVRCWPSGAIRTTTSRSAT